MCSGRDAYWFCSVTLFLCLCLYILVMYTQLFFIEVLIFYAQSYSEVKNLHENVYIVQLSLCLKSVCPLCSGRRYASNKSCKSVIVSWTSIEFTLFICSSLLDKHLTSQCSFVELFGQLDCQWKAVYSLVMCMFLPCDCSLIVFLWNND